MIEATGIVTAVDGDYASVQVDQTGCGRCHEKGGCGGNPLGKLFCSTPRSFRVLNPGKSSIGERVTIVIADGSIQRSAFRAYVLPLMALFLGAFIGHVLAGELGAIGGSLAGLVCGWLWLRHGFTRSAEDNRNQAYIKH